MLVGSLKSTFSPYTRCNRSPPHSLVCLLLLGNPRWFLSFAFALRSPHSALTYSKPSEDILAFSIEYPSLISANKSTLLHLSSPVEQSPGPPNKQHRNFMLTGTWLGSIHRDRRIVTLRSAAAQSSLALL